MIKYKPTAVTIKTLNTLKQHSQQVGNAIRQGAFTAGKVLEKDLKQEMTKRNVTGKKYKVYIGIGGRKLVKPRIHTASRKNEYPAIITGTFRKSVGFDVRGSKKLVFGSKDFAKGYAKFLEKRNKPIKRTAIKNNTKVKQIISKRVYDLLK